MIGYARKRTRKHMADKLAGGIIAAFKEEGCIHTKRKKIYSQKWRKQI